MAVDLLSAYRTSDTISSSSTGVNGDTASASLSENYETFITLLTTQLQNQDPLSPMDSSQFTQQLVQFSAVEQQITTNQNLEQLISLQQTNGAVTMLGFIGKDVEVGSDKLVRADGETSSFAYHLDDVASEVTVTIKNSNGTTVRTITGNSGTIGRHDMTWDGKDDGGIVQPNGTYTVSVTGKKSDGSDATVGMSVFNKVDGVEATSSGAVLSSGDQQISVDSILSIRDHVTATTTTGT